MKIKRDHRGRIDDWRVAIATGLAIALPLVALQSCGSDDDGGGPSEPPEPRSIDVSTSNEHIQVRRIFMEDNDLPLTCVIYSDVGGGGLDAKYGLGAGISCDWVGFHEAWLDRQ